jgi:hypothetical protein
MAQYRTDDGEVVEVDFATAMECGAFYELPDGRLAKRINRPSMKKRATPVAGTTRPIVSDAMGFADHQLAEMEADRQRHSFTDIEFRPDPDEPRFYQVHCGSEDAKRRYMEHRGFTDRNSSNGSGAMLDPTLLEKSKAIVLREHGDE